MGAPRRSWKWPAVVAGAAVVGAAIVARPTRVAEVSREGRTLSFPLPTWSIRTGSGEGRATYLGLFDPRFPASSGGWRHVEQMGSAHTFVGDGATMTLVTRKRTRWLTELHLAVAPAPAGP